MTRMWPGGGPDGHHGSHEQHIPQLAYHPGYAGVPVDMYGPQSGGFDGWTAAQAAAQRYGVPGAQMPPHQHMSAAHPMSRHHVSHHMVPQHMPHGRGNSMGSSLRMMVPPWQHQHMHMPPMMHMRAANSPPGGYTQHESNNVRSNWPNNHKSAGFAGAGRNHRQQSGSNRVPAPGRGGRGRRQMALNPNIGNISDAAVEEFAAAIKHTPADAPLDRNALEEGLSNLDSRGLASLLKDLTRDRHSRRAREVFDFLRVLPTEHALAPLCDVFTYTAMVSLCVDDHELQRAMDLVAEMKKRRVECNVHTYTALMNVAIKSGQLQKALDVYQEMLRDGCTPNVVTFNTLIDVYGKTGQWAEALRVIETMSSSNTKPVTRTYNTLMIACNTSGQWQEALNVYNDMISRGHAPNTTTYNALISAYSKASRLEKVMEVYREMLRSKCERSVITYSALINACEKAGQWQLALELFGEMLRERCVPNVITYNSLITACAQGAQWSKAAELFEKMKENSCKPDVVTYTALVSAYERGGQWMRALEAFTHMQQQSKCKADAILYNTLLDVLWDTGVTWAQHCAAALFRGAVEEGHFRGLPLPNQSQRVSEPLLMASKAASAASLSDANDSRCGSATDSPTAAAARGPAPSRLELGMQGVAPGVAMLMLHCWLADLRAFVLQHQDQPAAGLPEHVLISTGRSRQRDHVSGILRDSTQALLSSWSSPFAASSSAEGKSQTNSNSNSSNPAQGGSSSKKLEASGDRVAEWLMQDSMTNVLEGFVGQIGRDGSNGGSSKQLVSSIAAKLKREEKLEERCQQAFADVKHFETSHCLSVQAMGAVYIAARPGLVAQVLELQGLGIRDDVLHDAVLLMDRAMSAAFEVAEEQFHCLAAACLHHVLSVDKHTSSSAPDLPQLCKGLGCESPEEVEVLLTELKDALKQDLASVSALRCLKLYFERMGYVFASDGTCSDLDSIKACLDLVSAAACDIEFLNYRPTVTAAAALYCQRLHNGSMPFWPSSLSGLTGYSNARTPELSAALGGAQRLWKQLHGPSQQQGPGGVEDEAGSGPTGATDETADAAYGAARAAETAPEASSDDVEDVTAKLATAQV